MKDDVLLTAEEDFEFFATHFLKIKPKRGGKLVPLALNKCQKHGHDLIEKQLRETGRVRALWLKGRQEGVSTYIEGRLYHRVWKEDGLTCFILTHEADATENLFNMAERYWENTPERYKPTRGAGGAKTLNFSKKNSSYAVGTARTKGTGRSQTVQLFHWSEVSHSQNQDEHAAGVMQTVPDEPGTEIILETTANGVGDLFHQMWKAAEKGQNGYIAIFSPWFWMDEYRAKCPNGIQWSVEERTIQAKNGLDNDQMWWRRLKINGEMKGDEDKFKQEYPMNADEAFLFSGRPYFPTGSLNLQEQNVRDPVAVGILEQVGDLLRFVPMERGWLEIFQWPDKKADYVLGADVAEGLTHGDLNSGHIIRRGIPAEQVARISPLCDPDDYGRKLVLAAKYFNGRVPMGIERNSMGIAAVLAAKQTGYAHLFQMPVQEGTTEEIESTRVGWITNIVSRPILCADLLGAVRDGTLIVRSRETLAQMRTFIKGSSGKPQAATNCWDDDVMGLGIAVQMLGRTSPIPTEDLLGIGRGGRGGGWQAA